jgi:hypothetical protein
VADGSFGDWRALCVAVLGTLGGLITLVKSTSLWEGNVKVAVLGLRIPNRAQPVLTDVCGQDPATFPGTRLQHTTGYFSGCDVTMVLERAAA